MVLLVELRVLLHLRLLHLRLRSAMLLSELLHTISGSRGALDHGGLAPLLLLLILRGFLIPILE